MDYFDVRSDAARKKEMLEWSDGRRTVPVIVEGSDVRIGFGGG